VAHRQHAVATPTHLDFDLEGQSHPQPAAAPQICDVENLTH
jgi:hypothetical protein